MILVGDKIELTYLAINLVFRIPENVSPLKPSSQYDAEPCVASRRVALRRVATRRVVHNFCAHARVRRTATTPIARVFGSKYKIYD